MFSSRGKQDQSIVDLGERIDGITAEEQIYGTTESGKGLGCNEELRQIAKWVLAAVNAEIDQRSGSRLRRSHASDNEQRPDIRPRASPPEASPAFSVSRRR